MTYPDTVRLATVTQDGYSDRTVTGYTEVPASFIKRSGYTHGANTEGEVSDAAVYLLPNATVLSKEDDLEGMYIHVEPFTAKTWYRVSRANVARRKLLDNSVDNVYCRLEKVAGLAYVSIS